MRLNSACGASTRFQPALSRMKVCGFETATPWPRSGTSPRSWRSEEEMGIAADSHSHGGAGIAELSAVTCAFHGFGTRSGAKLDEIHHSAGDSAAFRPLQLWGGNSCGFSYFGLLRPTRHLARRPCPTDGRRADPPLLPQHRSSARTCRAFLQRHCTDQCVRGLARALEGLYERARSLCD